MTKEEKEAVERIEETFYSDLGKGINKFQKITLYEEGIEDTRTALNLIQKQQKEIEEKEYLYQRALSDTVLADKRLVKKDKIIDLMTNYIYATDYRSECGSTRTQVKQYFEKKVSEK